MCNCKKPKTKTATRAVKQPKRIASKTFTKGGKKYIIKPKK